MEQTPADARAAPSASVPNDVDMGVWREKPLSEIKT